MPGVFICYQKSSTRHVAGRLYSYLSRRFGEQQVFRDSSRLRAGDLWWQEITRWIQQADALVVLMGSDWLPLLEASNTESAPERGWVQREIMLALENGIDVIPVLVDDAEMPSADVLPADIASIHDIQAHFLLDRTFDIDISTLGDELEEHHGLHDPRSPARRRWERVKKIGGVAGAWIGVVAAVLVIWAFFFRQENRPPIIEGSGRIEAVAGNAIPIDILRWVSDPDGDEVSLVVDATSLNGATVDDEGDGTVTYVAPTSLFGDDSFGFEAVDKDGARTAGSVFVDVLAGAMESDLNVAVAGLVAVGEEAQSLGRASSEAVLEMVTTALDGDEVLRTEVAGPNKTGIVEGTAFDEQALAVEAIAERLNAHIVLYGVLSSDGGSTTVEPRFYLAPKALAGASELSGSYELDEVSVSSSGEAAVRLELESVIGPTIAAIGDLTRGLAFYQVNRYVEAEAAFLEAVDAWPTNSGSSNGQEVIWHLLGDVAGEQGRLGDAATFFQRAINVGEDDARATFGLTEVRFLQARGQNCGGESEPDVAVLNDAAAAFAAIQSLPEPVLSFLHARSRVEIGRVLLCLTLNGEDRGDEARLELEAVIAEYESESRLNDLIGEAHQALGLYHTIRQDHDAAITEYRLAIDVTNEESRRAFFHMVIAGIYECDLDDREAALVEFASSDALVSTPLQRRECDATISED